MSADGDAAMAQTQLIANLASIPDGPSTVPVEAIDEMFGYDYMAMTRYFNEHFLGLGQGS